jgi:colicin import membrane protein
MTGNRFIRRGIRSDLEPKLGRAFLVSFFAHLFIVLIFSGLILPRFDSDRPPVYYVDLVNLPVERPQAGRPDAAQKKETKKKADKKSSTKAKKDVAASVKKETVKTAAPEKAEAAVEESGPSDADIATKIARMQQKDERKKEREALKQKLAALATQDSRGEDAAPDAPVGVPDGTGDEVGISWQLWLQAFLKQQWALSEYQVTRLDLEAEVFIEYDSNGQMTDFRFLEKSGDRIFDDSVKAAILKSRQLPKPPPVAVWKVEVVFNLKDLLD